MVTGGQIRAARGMLRWRVEDLALQSGVGARTILRLETVNGLPQANTSTLEKIRKAFEAEGIKFIGAPDDGPGIRIRTRSDEALARGKG